MDMTGFQNTDYTARTNRFYQGGGSAKSSTRPVGESASKSSFAERMAAQRQQEQGGQETTAEEEVKRYKKGLEQELYSRIASGRHVKKEEEYVLFQPKNEGSGVFSKKTLAELAGYGTERDVSWGDDGKETLTEDQIGYLKEKYDVEDMTEADYQALLAELAEMNVLSGEDVKRQFVRKMPPCTTMIMPGHMDLNPYSAGNYLEKLQKELKETEYILSMINAGKCSVSPAVSLEAVREFYKEEQEYQKMMAEIFRQLQTGTSRKASVSGTEKP